MSFLVIANGQSGDYIAHFDHLGNVVLSPSDQMSRRMKPAKASPDSSGLGKVAMPPDSYIDGEYPTYAEALSVKAIVQSNFKVTQVRLVETY